MADQPLGTGTVALSMTDVARRAADAFGATQEKKPGKKVRVIAIARGYDGFKIREEGERFVWHLPNAEKPKDKPKPGDTLPETGELPSWMMLASEFDKDAKRAAGEELDEELA